MLLYLFLWHFFFCWRVFLTERCWAFFFVYLFFYSADTLKSYRFKSDVIDCVVSPVSQKLQSPIDQANCMDGWCIDRAEVIYYPQQWGHSLWVSQKPQCPRVPECVTGTSISMFGPLPCCCLMLHWH